LEKPGVERPFRPKEAFAELEKKLSACPNLSHAPNTMLFSFHDGGPAIIDCGH